LEHAYSESNKLNNFCKPICDEARFEGTWNGGRVDTKLESQNNLFLVLVTSLGCSTLLQTSFGTSMHLFKQKYNIAL
jgi:hypothetical protein